MDYHLFRVEKVWHYRFQVARKRTQRSTRETVKHRADAIARRAYEKATLWTRGEEPVPTLRQLVPMWLRMHQVTASSAHIKSVETFGRLHLYGLADVLIDEITTTEVEEARLLHLQNHAPASANHWLKVLRTICNWAVRRGLMPRLPWSVSLLKVQKRPRTTLPISKTADWLRAVDIVADEPATSTGVRLMMGLGLRENETITARWEWLDWERKQYTPGRTKGREALPLPVPAWLLDHLRPMRQSEGPIVARVDRRPMRAGYTRAAFRAANAVCEIRGLTPHRLRGTYATLLSEQHVPAQTIQRLMRHKDIRTTMGYLEENLDLAIDAQARIADAAQLGKQEVSGEKVANDA